MKIDNPKTYAGPNHKTLTLTVEFVLDPVKGTWHQPEDLMNWIAHHSYVKSVELNQTEPAEQPHTLDESYDYV